MRRTRPVGSLDPLAVLRSEHVRARQVRELVLAARKIRPALKNRARHRWLCEALLGPIGETIAGGRGGVRPRDWTELLTQRRRLETILAGITPAITVTVRVKGVER